MTKYWRLSVYRLEAFLFAALAAVVIFPALASASVAQRARVVGSFMVGGYQVKVFTLPETVTAGKETAITFKIHDSSNNPARAGEVYVSTARVLREGFENQAGGEALYKRAREADGLGDYEFDAVFDRAGKYLVKMRIDRIEGRTFAEPLSAGFALAVKKAPNRALRLSLVLLAALLMTAVMAYVMGRRGRAAGPAGLNLLDISWLKRGLRLRYVQPIFQVPMLAVLVVLIPLAFFDVQDGGRNLSTKVIWTIWWAGVIFTFVLVGRVWCFMCPVGAVSEWVSRAAWPARRFPKRLRNLWIANVLFILLTWLDAQLGVVRSPWVTGALILVIVGVSVLTALFYQRRTFCRYLCPIGGLIGLYSMFSPVELRSRDEEACRLHGRKDCYLGNENGLGCPMFETVPAMDGNSHCNFCGQCVKSCPRDNIAIRLRPFFKDAWSKANRSFDQAAMAVVLVGISIFVTGDMLEPWDGWMRAAMALVPVRLLGIQYEYTVEVITKSALYFSISLLIIPAMVFFASHASNLLAGRGNRGGVMETFTAFGYMFIPVGLSMHLAHNLGHLLNESAGVVPAFQRFVNLYTPFSLGEPNWSLASATMVGPGTLYVLQMALLLVFYGFSLYAGYRLSLKLYGDSRVSFRAFIPMVAVSFVLMAVNIYLLNLPMAPRHIH